MKVSELIEWLKTQPQNEEVFVSQESDDVNAGIVVGEDLAFILMSVVY